MGCISSKGLPENEFEHIDLDNRDKKKSKSARKISASSKRDNLVDGSTARLIFGNAASAAPSSSDDDENGGAQPPSVARVEPQSETAASQPSLAFGQTSMGRISSLANGEKGALVIAGWPSWLASVAAEAINGWLPRKADSFQKLEKEMNIWMFAFETPNFISLQDSAIYKNTKMSICTGSNVRNPIGQGTYSSVYKARDLEANKIVALKKVRFANMDPESVRFMAREIIILRRLVHPNVMKLEGLITSRVSGSLYLIFEYMEHDLVGIAGTPGNNFTEPQIKCYMQQLLRGLEHCHSRGVLHRDIKGSNLLIDNHGNLKIGDFGLATFFSQSQKQPLTSRVVTLWYRPPELLLGATQYGDAVDLWSTGCILAELFTGKPIMPGRTEVEQLHKIFKLCGSPSEEYWKKSKLPHATIFKPQRPYKRCVAETFKELPSSALALLEVLLAVEPDDRGTASSALQNEFFTTSPLPCDPSSLPKYPPSKEFDRKLREEEARRKMSVAKGDAHESVRNASREPRAKPAPHANAELQSSIQKRIAQQNLTSVSECFNPEEDGGAGFRIEPPKGEARHAFMPTNNGSSRRIHMTGNQSVQETAFSNISPRRNGELRNHASNMEPGAADLCRRSNPVAVGGSSYLDMSEGSNCFPHWPEEHLDSVGGAELSEKCEWSCHLLDQPKPWRKKNEPQFSKESRTGYASKKNRIHYSGPLMPPDGNLEEMLKQQERRIQDAVRKARVDKSNAHDDNVQTESLLHGNRGR